MRFIRGWIVQTELLEYKLKNLAVNLNKTLQNLIILKEIRSKFLKVKSVD